MTNLRETVARAILTAAWGVNPPFEWTHYTDEADAAIAAMQPTLDELRREMVPAEWYRKSNEQRNESERQRDAALDALKVARNAINKAASQFEFYAENHRRKNTKDGDQKAEVNGDLGCEMRQALAQIDAAEEPTAASLPRS